LQILATLRSLAMNALRLDGFWSITEGLAALAHDIRGLLAILGWREPAQELSSAWLLMSPGGWVVRLGIDGVGIKDPVTDDPGRRPPCSHNAPAALVQQSMLSLRLTHVQLAT
jgi:hypothetical protein